MNPPTLNDRGLGQSRFSSPDQSVCFNHNLGSPPNPSGRKMERDLGVRNQRPPRAHWEQLLPFRSNRAGASCSHVAQVSFTRDFTCVCFTRDVISVRKPESLPGLSRSTSTHKHTQIDRCFVPSLYQKSSWQGKRDKAYLLSCGYVRAR